MSEKSLWRRYYTNNIIREKIISVGNRISKKICDNGIRLPMKEYAHKKVLSRREANRFIYEKIMLGKSCMVARYGGNEINIIATVINGRYGIKDSNRGEIFESFCNGAGFFPHDITMCDRFVDMMLKDSSMLDLIGAWYLFMEDYVITKFASQTSITRLTYLEPWELYSNGIYDEIPWTAALKNKKVLVIHPFANTIQKQYLNNRKEIFRNISADILPEFELLTLKSVVTLAGEVDNRFENWFEALAYMKSQCRQLDFDIAIIGCGAYGFPLAAEVKRMGKIAIHLGGATQLMFGIIGKRWENYNISKIFNECWTRPSKDERPQKAETVEGACYW